MRVYSVSECNELLRTTLAETVGEVAVRGEVVDYRDRSGQLVFFEIKDETSRLLCFLLRYALKVSLADGQEVIVRGVPSVFRKNTGLHLRVTAIELLGEGALRKALEALARKLEAEGLFAPERKRLPPPFPERIVLITSPDAAAYTDVLRVLKNRWPVAKIIFLPVAVQGKEAVGSIVEAFQQLKKLQGIDHAILTRGGGSLEDLVAFNSEEVARAVYGSPVPVVCGVGHERDWTIADLVADRRAATPSNAAEVSVPSLADVLLRLDTVENDLGRGVRDLLAEQQERVKRSASTLREVFNQSREQITLGIERFRLAFQTLRQALAQQHRAVGTERDRLRAAVQAWVDQFRAHLGEAHDRIQAVSPQAVLRRGYSLTFHGRKLVRSLNTIAVGDTLRTVFTDGSARSTVEGKERSQHA